MIITIGVILAAIFGILSLICAEKKNWDWLFWTGLIPAIVGAIFSIICIIVCIIVHIPTHTVKTLNVLQHKRAGLIMRYEACNQSDDLVIISEIEDFNAEIENSKYDLNGPWTNWFISPAYGEIETIDIRELDRKPIEIEIEENN